MGLSERKVKQRIGNDPRNLTWSNDTNRFSYQHMKNLGWQQSSGIGGSNLEGNPNHIAVVRKLDNGGIGMARAKKEGDDMAAGAGQAGQGFEDVLKRLAAGSPSGSGASTPTEENVTEIKKRNRIASRQKHLLSKRLASSSPAALAEILGVPVSSLPASPSPVSTPASPSPAPSPASSALPASTSQPELPAFSATMTPSEPVASSSTTPLDTERSADETISTSTVSVSDYFRQKMREKMRARQIAAGETVTDLPSIETPKPVTPDTDWKGERPTFDESEVKLEDLGGELSAQTEALEEQASKETEKKEKKKRKRERDTETGGSASQNKGLVKDEDREARKEAKRREKEKKHKRPKEEKLVAEFDSATFDTKLATEANSPRVEPVETVPSPSSMSQLSSSHPEKAVEEDAKAAKKARKEAKRLKKLNAVS